MVGKAFSQRLYQLFAYLGEGFQGGIELLVCILGLFHPKAGRHVPQGGMILRNHDIDAVAPNIGAGPQMG